MVRLNEYFSFENIVLFSVYWPFSNNKQCAVETLSKGDLIAMEQKPEKNISNYLIINVLVLFFLNQSNKSFVTLFSLNCRRLNDKDF